MTEEYDSADVDWRETALTLQAEVTQAKAAYEGASMDRDHALAVIKMVKDAAFNGLENNDGDTDMSALWILETLGGSVSAHEELKVYELGEDGGSWFVENAETFEEAERAVRSWLDETLGEQADNATDRDDAEELLEQATATMGRWWVATGHTEGELIDYEEPSKWLSGVRLE
ncbi:MAG: hypothetical protein H7288_11360 [Kineosporiaceae bacterium]|nr:hypothetical protein [Aeromicrobium sp.]